MHLASRLLIILLFFFGCTKKSDDKKTPLFTSLTPKSTGIEFINKVENTADFNIFLYRNFYNGGGVGIGDINNDNLPDVYLTSNMGENKLYLNKGGFQFEDITKKAGVGSVNKWSTGVVFVDVNNDGLLDIYVCNAGYRKNTNQKNELYINNGDLTFTERAEEYGLAENGYTTHAAFFDYDKDGDLDVYILNNSFIPVHTLNYSNKRELPADQWPVKDFLRGGGDRLLKNEGGKFVEVTSEAGIYNSLIGFGLSITIGDVNGDGWDDIYISNDFFERDYLYINQKNGTFNEELETQIGHVSAFSMGADIADINNDGHQDIFATDMLPDDEQRLKATTSFEPYSVYELKLKRDFYYQFMQNTLQLNQGNGHFSEIAHYGGVAASDWSWGALMFDVNNDGFKDIYVSNGIYHDITDQDFIDFFADDMIQQMALSGGKKEVNDIVNKMPSKPIVNKLFVNNGDLTFQDLSDYTAVEKTFSNGAAYGDLDNDGDLDLIVSNVNQPVSILRNNTVLGADAHYLKVKVVGSALNTFSVGVTVALYSNGNKYVSELMPSKGFQSSVDYPLFFGLGKVSSIDSMVVNWADNYQLIMSEVPVDTLLVVNHKNASSKPLMEGLDDRPQRDSRFKLIKDSVFIQHKEDRYVDFYNEGLVIEMLSHEGPKGDVADVNGDGIDDILIGGARGQSAQLYIGKHDGWQLKEQSAFEQNSLFEDTAIKFFDIDNDGDKDVFIGSGGNYDLPESMPMQDRIYVNDGQGNFTLHAAALNNNGYNTAVALPYDIDNDGDLDLYVGSRSVPQNYGKSPKSYFYINDGVGNFKDEIKKVAPALEQVGMVTDAALVDIDNDRQPEMVVVGEWMSPIILKNSNGKLTPVKTGLEDYSGWWNAVKVTDIDSDGDKDLIIGNRGENFYFTGDLENPAKLWLYDFDNNHTEEKIITHRVDGRDVTVHMKKELTSQIVSLKKQNLKHKEFATKAIQDLFKPEILNKAQVKLGNWFKSSMAINDGNGNFTIKALPQQAQLSSVNAIHILKAQNDVSDIVLAGNNSYFLPQYSKLDASTGILYANQSGHLILKENSIMLDGDVKQILKIINNNKTYLLCLRNDKSPMLYQVNAANPSM